MPRAPIVVASVALCLVACEEARPPRTPQQTEMVPANSAAEAATVKPKVVKTESSTDEAPAGGSGGAGGGGADEPGETASAAKPKGTTKGASVGGAGPAPSGPVNTAVAGGSAATGKPTKAECEQLFDRYIDLEATTNTQLAGIPPEMIKQMLKTAKQQASSQKTDPCTQQGVTRAQYNCGMAATTTAQWQRCVK